MAAVVAAGAATAQFVPNETEVCPASAKVYDPEFHVGTQQMVYFDGKGGLRFAPVLADGSIGTPDCGGTLLSRNVTISLPGLPYKAGPEWALSSRGLELYYTKLDREGHAYMARARFNGGNWRLSSLPDSTDRGLALLSTDEADTEPRLVYMHTPVSGSYTLNWREASRPETEAPVPGTVDPGIGGAPRWVPGRRTLSLALPDATGTKQAALYDVDTAELTYLTGDAGSKDEVWLWQAPEFGGALALMTVADGCCLRFYREVASVWQLYREIRADDFSARPLIFSPEVLVHNGHSYVAMALAAQRIGSSEIWIAEVGLGGLQPLLVSDPARRNVSRTEPEWMVTPEGVFVYVTATETTNRFALNRLKTPLPAAAR